MKRVGFRGKPYFPDFIIKYDDLVPMMYVAAGSPLVAVFFGVLYMCKSNKCTTISYVIGALISIAGLIYVAVVAFGHKKILDAQ